MNSARVASEKDFEKLCAMMRHWMHPLRAYISLSFELEWHVSMHNVDLLFVYSNCLQTTLYIGCKASEVYVAELNNLIEKCFFQLRQFLT